MFCSVFSPGTEYCYDNVVADLSLNSGAPTGINGVWDLFTWKGFGEMFTFALLFRTISFVVENLVLFGAFSFWFGMDSSIPLCSPGEEYKVLGYDICNTSVGTFSE